MKTLITTLILLLPIYSHAQDLYPPTLKTLEEVLEGERELSFGDIVFAVENAYYDGTLDYEAWANTIIADAFLVQQFKAVNPIDYTEADYDKINTYAALFRVFTDTVTMHVGTDTLKHLPYKYDFLDIFGAVDWDQTFTTKLLRTGTGNCHSMPYLYKILCEILGVPCQLALAPNHVYIKHQAQNGGWYNTELTGGSFPVDSWLMASGYVSLEAVQKGIYLDTLSHKESIALCVIDLAQGFNHRFPGTDGEFVIQCCDLALRHFPDYPNALLLKAETRLHQLQQMQQAYAYRYLKDVTQVAEGKQLWDEMNSLYMQLYQLGYRQMPESMYREWLVSLIAEKDKYNNKAIEQWNKR